VLSTPTDTGKLSTGVEVGAGDSNAQIYSRRVLALDNRV
jgi:hypothetical protein